MARIRTIKPEFFTSADIVELTPLARLFYIALWCESDREGRLNWNLKTLKMRYLPGDDCDIGALAGELEASKLIKIYTIDDKQYAEIPSFHQHQVINNRESDSIIPVFFDVSVTRESGVKAEGKEGREGKGKERKGKERPSDDGDDSFAVFWSRFPKKVGKKPAQSAWKRLSKEKRTTALGDCEARYTGIEKQYIPNPATYLNQERWNDEIVRPGLSIGKSSQDLIDEVGF